MPMFPSSLSAAASTSHGASGSLRQDSPQAFPTAAKDVDEPGSEVWLRYLDLADKFDKNLAESWRDDMDSLLIFAALFSAIVTAFAVESYKTLKVDSGDSTVQILLHISQQFANGTGSPAASLPSTFTPQPTDVAINTCWFLSLAFSLACALGAVLVRQWARDYLRIPQTFSSVTERARMRQVLFEQMGAWRMEVMVEIIPALLHISLILFIIGLLLFLRSVNHSVALYLFAFSTMSGAAYVAMTIIPDIYAGCPYRTPFTHTIAYLVPTAVLSLCWIGDILLASLLMIIYTTVNLPNSSLVAITRTAISLGLQKLS